MKRKPISVIRQMFKEGKIDDEMIQRLELDERKGVQEIVKKYFKEKAIIEKQWKSFQEMTRFENRAKREGRKYIAGVDEAGRGPLAGPVVTAAVILPADFVLLGLNDSKQLSIGERNRFFEQIKDKAISYHITIVSNEKIDEMNILQATKFGMKESIEKLKTKPDYCLLDAVELDGLPCASQAIVKGDERSVSIAAASILAKVTRDCLMQEIHEEYPMYGFASNMGYGTKVHIEAIEKHGLTKYHRKSFGPVRNVMDK